MERAGAAAGGWGSAPDLVQVGVWGRAQHDSIKPASLVRRELRNLSESSLAGGLRGLARRARTVRRGALRSQEPQPTQARKCHLLKAAHDTTINCETVQSLWTVTKLE